MGSSSDIERVFPGNVLDTADPTTIKTLHERVVKLETVLSQKATQWNSPSLLETLSNTEYKVQFGSATVVASAFPLVTSFALPTAWSATHAYFGASFRPLTSWDNTFQCIGCGANGVASATYGIYGTTAQSYEMLWVSIGK